MAYDDGFRFDGALVVKKSSAHPYSPSPPVPEMQKSQGMPSAWRAHALARPRKRQGSSQPINSERGKVQSISATFPAEGARYRANLPIMVLAFRDNHQAAVTIPENHLFDVVGTDRDDRFVIVRVREEEFLVFASDLRDRGTVIARADCSPRVADALLRERAVVAAC